MKKQFECLKRIVRLLAIEKLEELETTRKAAKDSKDTLALWGKESLLTSLLDDLEGQEHFDAKVEELQDNTKIGGTD